jgi:D-amino-acid dehydrogenase
MSAPDVVIVGGGAIGAAAARELARAGASVTLIERGALASGCSSGNAGLISPSHSQALASGAAIRSGLRWLLRRDSPFHVRPRWGVLPWLARFGAAALPSRSAAASATLRGLVQASLDRHADLAREGLPTSFERRGILGVFESDAALARAQAQAAAGDAPVVLDAATAQSVEPALTRAIAGALWYENEGHCDPEAFVEALADDARSYGARIRTGVEALAMARSNGRIAAVETTAGRLVADHVVLAAGAWTRPLAAGAGVHIPLEGGKGYHVELEATAPQLGVPMFFEEARVTATPIGGRLRLTGTLDLSGLDLAVDPVRLAAIGRAARGPLGLASDARPVGVWRGLRPCAPDGLPVVGRAPGVDNLVLATGHAMLGIALAPVTADIVADLVGGRTPRHDVTPLDPSRFSAFRDAMTLNHHSNRR